MRRKHRCTGAGEHDVHAVPEADDAGWRSLQRRELGRDCSIDERTVKFPFCIVRASTLDAAATALQDAYDTINRCDCTNGVTDSTNTLDEGDHYAVAAIGSITQALRKLGRL